MISTVLAKDSLSLTTSQLLATGVKDSAISIERVPYEDINTTDWNQSLLGAPESRIQQSVQGAKIRWEMNGEFPYFLNAIQSNQKVGQLFLHRGFLHPDLMQWARPALKSPILHRLWGVLSWLGGPVVYDEKNYKHVLRSFLLEVELLIEEYGITAVKNATPAFYGREIDWSVLDAAYAEFSYEKYENATIVLELDRDLEALFSNLTKEARKEIQKAEHQGVTIVQDNTVEGLSRYYEIRLKNAKRNGLRPPSRDYIFATEATYMADGLAKLFLAEHEGHTVAGQMLLVFNGNVQLAGVYCSDYAQAKRLLANDLLQWEVIKWARQEGHKRIDWSGFTPNPQTEKDAAINCFKEKWGGQVTHYHTYGKILAYRRFAGLNWVKKQVRKCGIR